MTVSLPMPMPTPSDPTVEPLWLEIERIVQRLTDLEIKAGFSEDLVDHLNQTIAEQQWQIQRLVRELQAVRQQSADAQPAAFRSLRDELPPHY